MHSIPAKREVGNYLLDWSFRSELPAADSTFNVDTEFVFWNVHRALVHQIVPITCEDVVEESGNVHLVHAIIYQELQAENVSL